MYRSLNNDFYYFSLSNRIRPFKIHSTNTKKKKKKHKRKIK
ncbi:hypothetical protein PFMALIP_02559 [Plasmodium falciparum MaliPS096_E11]|uniref:Uncharacterized protein n=1 Tax=Plasmodium falciparum MaliPS096_E11 TaxID=1036727 RepID=A0A024WSC5_PLAFA|nr:hypothetical protein PFMALIP_02559 [Plasmodium falciparum MaliPS096_E11]